jgi:subtilase family serine protease
MVAVGAIAPLRCGASQAPKRLSSGINDSETFVLKGNTRPVVASGLAQDQGPVSAAQVMPRMSLHFKLTAAQQADLDQLLAAQQNRRSAQFHKFLTPEEYADRFGLNSADIEKVTAWLENSGFSNVQVARSRSWVSFSGTAGQAQNAFHTSIHNYTVNGEAHFANASDPQLPKALEGIAEGVRGLHNFRMKPHIRRPQAHFTSSISGNTYLAPDDWTTIYDVKPLYNAGLDGTGVTIAVVGQSDVNATDLSNFRTAAGLPAKTITTVIPPGDKDPGLQFTSGDESESDLDLEWSNAIAKNADILFITADSNPDNGVEDAIAYAIDNNVAPILSTSYGLCEPDEALSDFDSQQTLFAQANAQGMTILAAAGDDGAADCDSATTETLATQGLAVDFPASSQYVTGVGGTTLQAEGAGTYFSSTNNSSGGSALSYIPEDVWNDSFQNATGGGVSILVAEPAWQSGVATAIASGRNVPDLALTASPNTDGLLYCTPYGTAGISTCVNGTFRNNDAQTTLNVTGGTSAGPPTMSGVLALLLENNGPGSRVGNINPNLYQLAAMFPPSTTTNNPFHDITSGNNNVACEGGTPNCSSTTPATNGTFGYSAGVGYDQTTGWGSIDAHNLVQDWTFDFKLSSSPSTLTIQAGSSSAATITATPQSNFNGMVTFAANGCSVSSTLPGVTCTVTAATVNASGNTTVTISVPSSASTPPLLRLLRKAPRLHPGWLLLALALLALAYTLRKQRFAFVRFKLAPSIYAYSAVALLAVTISAVSCGGGSSGGGGGGGSPTPLALSCTLPSTAQVAVAYTGSCTASGGTAPYNYSISAGALPSGLTLSSSTGAITGSPTAPGTSSFTVQASDSSSPAETATQAESNFAVTESGVVTVTATSGELVNTAQIAVTVQ